MGGLRRIFQRFDALQWVNEGFLIGYGWKGQVPFLDPATLAALARNTPDAAQARQTIFSRFSWSTLGRRTTGRVSMSLPSIAGSAAEWKKA